VPDVVEMQSEGGAAGAVHGALQGGALTTTFTASQGLLLMIPNLYKIAGELTSFCMHVAARTVATHALSIFGDHSDVMAVRQTGFALLASGSVQEAHDFACIGQAATLRTRVPFLHFFDGFRTSHEIAKVDVLGDDDLRSMIDDELVRAHRQRALTPDHPVLRGTAQNPDVFFQAREACNSFYDATPQTVRETMLRFSELSGRRYDLFDYVGHPEAERVVVLMGSGAETAEETVDWLVRRGEPVGVLKVRLYRPFSVGDFVASLPSTVRSIAVLDRTKEPGAVGEPLYQDVVAALAEASCDGSAHSAGPPRVIGGRYGLSSKEFTPAQVKSVFDELAADKPKRHFTVGIVDDVTNHSLVVDESLDIESEEVVRAVFYGLGSDGTVGANKNSIKIIAEEASWAQGYFVYDSKKSGAMTISHLRFGPHPIRSSYLIKKADFVACHHFGFLDTLDVLEAAAPGGVFLLNAPYPHGEVWNRLPREIQESIVEKQLRFYVIDARNVARETGLGVRINTIMQTCFFALSEVIPEQVAIEKIKSSIEETYGKRGPTVVRRNFDAVDAAVSHLRRVEVPSRADGQRRRPPLVPADAPDFVRSVTAVLMAQKGDCLPVSAFPPDGTWPVGTSKWEKRSIAAEIPVWSSDVCIQCNQCALVCPHAAIRTKVYAPEHLEGAPGEFRQVAYVAPDHKGNSYTVQVAPDDCTGCHLCVMMCPAKDKSNPRRKAINMEPLEPVLERERTSFEYFLSLPEMERSEVGRLDAKGSQFLEPLFEYSGACAGCGETPYIKLLTQLFGDRALIANATGCSSIYGGNLPTTPFTTNAAGRGPAWSNSLFEDNAEFGFGMRLAVDQHAEYARSLLGTLADRIGGRLVEEILASAQNTETEIEAQRRRVEALRQAISGVDDRRARALESLADYLVRKSIWLVGGDGWAYDIGYGGLDHVLAQNRNVNVLVLDTELYSNTGGQQSKATPLGAAAKFAIAGKDIAKKDLGLEAMSYRHVYVARVAMGAKVNQVVHAFSEADSFPGPSLIIAYSHCIAHGYDMRYGAEQQKLAVACGTWPLYRYDPRRVADGKPPLELDSAGPKVPLSTYMRNEGRFQMVEKSDPARFKRLMKAAQDEVSQRYAVYQQLAGIIVPVAKSGADEPSGEPGSD
jgi:pyruvate-ferredoxin/flavodoxin oxidoreductase